VLSCCKAMLWSLRLTLTMFLLLGLVVYVESFSSNDIQGQVTISQMYPSTGSVVFGEGYNTLTLNTSDYTAVESKAPLSSPRAATFTSLKYSISLYKSREEYYEDVVGQGHGVSVSESAVGNNRSAYGEFISHTTMTSLDSMLVASVDAISDTDSSHGVKMRGEGVEMLRQGEVKSFVERYGTHYLRKVVYGGTLMLLIKFSSSTLDDKAAIDIKLAECTGTMSNETHFSQQLANITSNSTEHSVHLYTAGGDPAPANITIDTALPYIFSFPEAVLSHHAVREVQYTALWTLVNCPSYALQRYLFPLQKYIDSIVHLSEGISDVIAEVDNARALRAGDLHYVSSAGWDKLDTIQSEEKRLKEDLQRAFQTTPWEKLPAVIAKYEVAGDNMRQKVEDVLKEERSYSSYMIMYLKNTEPGLGYVGAARKHLGFGYPQIGASGIPLYMKEVMNEGPTKITYGSSLVYLMSEVVPDHYLCMGKNDWYVFWKLSEDAWPGYCQWRLVHATDNRKKWLEYGDQIIIYNGYWTDVIAGESKLWLGAIDSSQSVLAKNRWSVEKTAPRQLEENPTSFLGAEDDE